MRVVEQAGAAAEAGLAIAKHVVGEADTWREIRVVAGNAVKRHARVAGEKQSLRRIRILLRPDPLIEIADPELLGEAFDLLPRAVRLVPQAVVERQPLRQVEAVVEIERPKVVAIVFVFAISLLEAVEVAEQEAGNLVVGCRGVECERALRLELVAKIDGRVAVAEANIQVVPADDPAHVVF